MVEGYFYSILKGGGVFLTYANMDNVSSQVSGSSSVLAADWNTYVRDNFDDIKSGHVVVADASARGALGVVAPGTMVFEASTSKLWVYTTAWFELGNFTQNTAIVSGGGPYSPFFTPVGMVTPFASATLPTGWLLCDGTVKSTTANPEYTALYSIIHNDFGGSGPSSFNVPNLLGRTIIGVGAGIEITAALGTVQGASSVTLTSAQSGVPAHTHPISPWATSGGAGNHNHSYYVQPGYTTAVSGGSGIPRAYDNQAASGGYYGTTGDGGGHDHTIPATTSQNNTTANAASSHTNIQPSLPLNYIIKY